MLYHMHPTPAHDLNTRCISVLTPQIMTWGQYAEAAVNVVGKHFGKEWPEYMPDYTKCADHFAIHAGAVRGSAVRCGAVQTVLHASCFSGFSALSGLLLHHGHLPLTLAIAYLPAGICLL